jgi:hypothetical protein
LSKGLGSLQTNVLGLMLATPGGDEIPVFWTRGRRVVRISHDMYDMRRISHDLQKLAGYEIWTIHKWWPRFSRAVRKLEARGILEFPSLVPLSDNSDCEDYGECGISRLSEGLFLTRSRGSNDKQRRFGRVLVEKTNLLNAYYKGLALVEQLAEKERIADAASKMRSAIMRGSRGGGGGGTAAGRGG